MPATVSAQCAVCATHDQHPLFHVREMYFGTGETFDYFECRECGTLQIREIPPDLARHYPEHYYSFAGTPPKPRPALESRLRRRRTDAWLGHGGALGGVLGRLGRRREYFDWFRGIPLSSESHILDVGCGGGSLLLKMRKDGFAHLAGLDPYIRERIDYGGGLVIEKRALAEEARRFDLVMLHHAFEHVADPAATMAEIARRLAPGGHALIRLPIAGGYAWRKYRQHWYALDAPRHLFIPTLRAMHLLAVRAGLTIRRVFFDSDVGQFLASEAYQRDIPLVEQMRSPPRLRSEAELAQLRLLAERLNLAGDGDSGGFVLARADA